MISEGTFIRSLELAERASHVRGCIVECGVWRGGMIAGIATVMGTDRNYYLCDSFEGLPPATQLDGAAALRWQSDVTSPHYHDNCTAEEGYAREAMALAGIRSFDLIKGWFNDTLPSLELNDSIALLRLDGDWYESTMACLDALFDKVAVGGLIIIDDYYTWDGCSRAVHDFLSNRSAVERIQDHGGVCFIEKRLPT
jgi:O-methyltransferase